MLSIVRTSAKERADLNTSGKRGVLGEPVNISGMEFTFWEVKVPNEQYTSVILSDGKSVATATLSLHNLPPGFDTKYPIFYFNRHFVEPGYRQNHLGTFLLKKVLDFAGREKISIYNECNPHGGMNLEQLTGFYLRHGFKILKKGVFYWSPG